MRGIPSRCPPEKPPQSPSPQPFVDYQSSSPQNLPLHLGPWNELRSRPPLNRKQRQSEAATMRDGLAGFPSPRFQWSVQGGDVSASGVDVLVAADSGRWRESVAPSGHEMNPHGFVGSMCHLGRRGCTDDGLPPVKVTCLVKVEFLPLPPVCSSMLQSGVIELLSVITGA